MFLLLANCRGNPIIPSLIRVPQHDSAIIQSDRIGGNFAYSTIEGHAYAALNPIIQNVHTPIGVNYVQPLMAPVPVLFNL